MVRAHHTVGIKHQVQLIMYLCLLLFLASLHTSVYADDVHYCPSDSQNGPLTNCSSWIPPLDYTCPSGSVCCAFDRGDPGPVPCCKKGTTCNESDKKCCPRKKVGEKKYTFSRKSPAAVDEYGCSSDCVYKEDEDGSETCFKPGPLKAQCFGSKCKKLPDLPKMYCQPANNTCWPSIEEINQFNLSINGNKESCLGIKKFITRDDQYAHKQLCLPYTGLLNNHNLSVNNLGQVYGGDLNVCRVKKLTQNNYQEPYPNCDANPFITKAYYKNNEADKIACMTPFQFLSNRNYKNEWMPFFIVTAETPEDVSKTIQFANDHNLGVAVMSTGHELQDRNAGPGPNSILIRTTCFQNFTAYNTTTITYDNDGKKWDEGYAVVGAGLTFGENYWYKLENAEGLYPLAASANREIAGGSCHSVGIVGWMLSGGKGWVTPMYGFGVDQLLHVDIVLADGTITHANYTYNQDLFWAIRGGGGGFGVITSLKMKLHKPRCETMDNCYSIWNTTWTGPLDKDSLDDIKNVLKIMFNWTATYHTFWNSLSGLTYDTVTKNFSLSINAEYFGFNDTDPDDYNSFETSFKTLDIRGAFQLFNSENKTVPKKPPTITDKYFCELFPDPENTSNCQFYPWTVQRWSQSIRMLVNPSTTLEPKFLDTLIDYWQPLCDKDNFIACSSGYQFHYFFTSGKRSYDTGGAISEGLREASMQIFNTGVNTNDKNLHMTFEEKESWMHYTLAPAMYQFSNTSYFNEAEYTLDPGQWQRRFWGKEMYCKLLGIKKKYDPEGRLNCRHCVGSEVWSPAAG